MQDNNVPTNVKSNWIIVIALLCILFGFIYYTITTPEEGIGNVTFLKSGSHFLDRPPFIVNVKNGQVVKATKYFWYYNIQIYDVDKRPKLVSYHRTLTSKTSGWAIGPWNNMKSRIETRHFYTYDDGSVEEVFIKMKGNKL